MFTSKKCFSKSLPRIRGIEDKRCIKARNIYIRFASDNARIWYSGDKIFHREIKGEVKVSGLIISLPTEFLLFIWWGTCVSEKRWKQQLRADVEIRYFSAQNWNDGINEERKRGTYIDGGKGRPFLPSSVSPADSQNTMNHDIISQPPLPLLRARFPYLSIRDTTAARCLTNDSDINPSPFRNCTSRA